MSFFIFTVLQWRSPLTFSARRSTLVRRTAGTRSLRVTISTPTRWRSPRANGRQARATWCPWKRRPPCSSTPTGSLIRSGSRPRTGIVNWWMTGSTKSGTTSAASRWGFLIRKYGFYLYFIIRFNAEGMQFSCHRVPTPYI